MNDEKLKKQLGANIAAYRKHKGLTQAGLAEKLNYSDKAVSKWERAESVPDVLTLVQLAELFSVSVDDLLVDPSEMPEPTDNKMERIMSAAVEKATKRKATKRIIVGLSSLLVWFIALLLFVVLSMMDIPKSWVAFFYAIPADAIVRLSLRSAWHDFRLNKWLVTIIMWGVLLSLFMTLLLFFDFNAWKIFLLGIPGQAAILMAFRLRKYTKEEQNG